MCLDGLAQGGGAVWRRGGVDEKPGERLHFGQTFWRWVCGLRGGGDLWSFAHKALSLNITGESTIIGLRHKTSSNPLSIVLVV
jgi:hypothetical protein